MVCTVEVVTLVPFAGAKADPTRLRLADIAESSVDPLARAVRHRLRRAHGIGSGVPVLLSTEKPRCGLVPAEGANLADYQACSAVHSSRVAKSRCAGASED